MPVINPQAFDVVFDQTFRSLVLLTPGNPEPASCVQRGVYLTWLSVRGWPFWLFEGKVTTETTTFDRGQRQQAGVVRSNQRESGELLTIRTTNLTETLAGKVATLFKSPAVFIRLTDADNEAYYLPVFIEPGSFPTWETGQGRGVQEVKLILPKQRSQRT